MMLINEKRQEARRDKNILPMRSVTLHFASCLKKDFYFYAKTLDIIYENVVGGSMNIKNN